MEIKLVNKRIILQEKNRKMVSFNFFSYIRYSFASVLLFLLAVDQRNDIGVRNESVFLVLLSYFKYR